MLRELADPEREAYFRGVQPIWGGGLNPDRFVAFQRRLADSAEAGRRYRLLGLFDGPRLVSAMKAYDLHGSYAGSPLRLLGIGAVYTPPPLRRRGYARQMLELAIADHRAAGFDAALLFSDIGGEYYERLGFRPVRSDECTAEAADLPRVGVGKGTAPRGRREATRRRRRSRIRIARAQLAAGGMRRRYASHGARISGCVLLAAAIRCYAARACSRHHRWPASGKR